MNWKSYQPSASRAFRRLTRPRVLAGLLALGASLPVYAQSTSDPWDNAVTVLKTAFTGTIATGLSLVAIVVGGLMFAYGEGQSKKTLAGIVFGVGMAIGAVNFMSWLFPS
jgi:type IV secretion system protein TrbC